MKRWLLLVVPGVLLIGGWAAMFWAHRAVPERVPLVPSAAIGAIGPNTNVVLVVGCTVRADQTTPWGAPTNVTPFLEELAHRGTRFANTIAAAPWTRPSLTAIFTGRHALSIAMTEAGSGRSRKVLSPKVQTLGELMKATGRRTFGATANPNADERFGMGQGFDGYEDIGTGWKSGYVGKVPGRALVDRAMEFVDEAPDRAFYLQLVTIDAHLPDTTTAWQRSRFYGTVGNDEVERYRTQLRDLDETLRALDEEVTERGLADSTVFVFVGDHGEGLSLPAHHGHGHGRFLFPSAVQVPWMMWGTGVARGRVVDTLVSHVDVLPTLAELVGEPVDEDVQGLSVAAAVRGEDVQLPRSHVFVDTWFRSASRVGVYSSTHMCQIDYRPVDTARQEERLRERIGVSGTFEEGCFDWRADREARHVIEDPELMGLLRPWRVEQQRLRHRFGDDLDVDDSEISEALEALGYVE